MKLICCSGLPAAGKSTWTHLYCVDHPDTVIVSKDQIRAELRARHGWVWSHHAEKRDVVPERDARIRQALRAGHSVISDDTNLTERHLNGLAMIASLEGASFEIQRFDVDVDVEECVRRDAERPVATRVGEQSIREMARAVSQKTRS